MIYFVTPTFIKTYTPVLENVDEKKIAPLAQFASKAFLLPMLGTYFFDDLLTKYNNQTLSTDEETLVNKMQFSISHRIAGDLALTLTYQLTNKGLQTQNGDNSESVDKSEVGYVRNHYLGEANYFEDEIKRYIAKNKELYPNFTSSLNTDSNLKSLCSWLGMGYYNCNCGYCGKYGTQNFMDGQGFIFI